jgi:hypothetical protein
MAKNVFILGAGASRDGGAPLMFDFLDAARELQRLQLVNDRQADFDLVFKAIASLQRVHSKSRIDLNNLEVVFAAFEIASVIGALPGLADDEVARLVPAMRALITRTFEERLDFNRSGTYREAPQPYWHFAELLGYLLEQAYPAQTLAIITFNYDVGVDFAVRRRRYNIDYAFESPNSPSIPVLKLHGSLNWFYCNDCQKIVPFDLTFLTEELRGVELHSFRPQLRLSSLQQQWLHRTQLGHDVAAEPFIVPPTWSKGEHQRTLASVWKRAALELRDAENIFIVGYSLPATDEFFRHLYALGTVGETVLQRLWVVDPDPGKVVEARYRSLLGPGAEQRFAFFPELFLAGIGRINVNSGRVRITPVRSAAPREYLVTFLRR